MENPGVWECKAPVVRGQIHVFGRGQLNTINIDMRCGVCCR